MYYQQVHSVFPRIRCILDELWGDSLSAEFTTCTSTKHSILWKHRVYLSMIKLHHPHRCVPCPLRLPQFQPFCMQVSIVVFQTFPLLVFSTLLAISLALLCFFSSIHSASCSWYATFCSLFHCLWASSASFHSANKANCCSLCLWFLARLTMVLENW